MVQRLREVGGAHLTRMLKIGRKAGYRRGIVAIAMSVALLTQNGCGNDLSRAATQKGSRVIARGQTFAGGSFVATLQRTSGCPLSVVIKESGTLVKNEMCYAHFESPERPRVSCLLGILAIYWRVLDAAHAVRLTLTDGQTVSSPVMVVPRQRGASAKLYYQAVRGPSPMPASVTELDARGRPLKTMAVSHVIECTKQPVKRLRNSTHVLARDRAPDGRVFGISSELSRILGKSYFGLQLAFEGSGATVIRSAALRLASPAAGVSVSSPAELEHILPLEWEVGRVCTPYRYGIIYGVLRSTHDEVFVRSGGGFSSLRRVSIPASVRPHSVLVYGVLRRIPNELIVRTPVGTTVVREKVSSIFAETPCV